MELSRYNFRVMIYYDFRRGLSPQECINQLISTFGDETPHKATIYRWYNKFNRGRSFLNDKFKEGRSKSVMMPENIDAIREMMKFFRHLLTAKFRPLWALV